MADGDLALPLGHAPLTASSAPAIRLHLGRPFRPPLNLPDEAATSPGLEVWTHSDLADSALYAMFGGSLRIVEALPGLQHSMVLDVDPRSQRLLNQIEGLLEPVPVRLRYENVDRDKTVAAVRALVATSFSASLQQSQQNLWHPLLRLVVDDHTVRQFLSSAQANNALDQAIDEFVSLIVSPPTPLYFSMPVLAGDCIGVAAEPLPGEQSPEGWTFGDTARRVTVVTEEYARNCLNPAYYLWRLLKNANAAPPQRRVTLISRAPSRPDSTFDHPLLDALQLDLDVPVQARPTVSFTAPGQTSPADVLLFSLGRLAEWQGYEFGQLQSSIQWRITDDVNLDFETRLRPGVAPQALQGVDINSDPAGDRPTRMNRMTRVWQDWGSALNEMCGELQFPTEIVAVTIAHESNNDARALALERLEIPAAGSPAAANPKKNPELRLQQAGVAQPLIDAYKRLTPRYGLTVPQPWPGAQAIDPERSGLTWDDLLQIVDVVPERMSPGLTQTLVATAIARVQWLQRWYGQNLEATFGVQLNVPGQPGQGLTRPRDWFLWLLEGRNSMLAGVAYHKYAYCSHGSRLDLPRSASLYNAGQRRIAAGVIEPNTKMQLVDPDLPGGPSRPNPWLMKYNNLRYPRDVTRFLNATVNVLNGGTLSLARFWGAGP